MRYFVNKNLTAPFNIAMDEWLLTHLKPEAPVFTLWQNKNAVIVGKHQNTYEEVNESVVKEKEIEVVRRVTGGGAVYHDSGNLNFTFIIPVAKPEDVDWKVFVQPIVTALHKLNIPVEITGRNDLVLDGKKISGNAQRYQDGYLMHHGTLMFDVNVETMVRVLNVSDEKFISKAVKSVRSRVGSIKQYAPQLTIEAFQAALTDELSNHGQDKPIQLTEKQLKEIKALEKEKFSTWAWNYGESPAFNYHAHEKFAGGILDIKAEIEQGLIKEIYFGGDFLGVEDVERLVPQFIGIPFDEANVRKLLEENQDRKYFGTISDEEVLSLIAK
ncbi:MULTISPECIES: lipoate--protein ligase [unclassified Enterococcus]|uniref:lipoate--protein ligase n=1 Tax=unclassified Enterococcus TaxID=2608891 RepID=UPI001554081B|nr:MULTISPECIES: lipoate--protein ligase [unclassified Enterococcus]MBS7576464.1 lipoate--protein ligase [Enterococcus sp. MMGLQ5-2]MBS7583696.1 lipoate--protein ligase [Enterococcus sp. MMGLQ5-1]NPD11557.1 lipoate--protein ligase [Enterococcus sp. MMGLQ5-1]NPD36301.1 lipoate--protein ligase [Enterococcus sp. MMGLQ5-2]